MISQLGKAETINEFIFTTDEHGRNSRLTELKKILLATKVT
jgi:hypothetical protein